MTIPSLDIVMPVFNRYKETLTSINALNKYKVNNLKLTVIDNGSDNDLRSELLKLYNDKFIDYLYFLNKNYGVSCACNVGWELSRSSFFMKLDNDIEIISPTWIEDIFSMWGKKRYSTIFGPDWSCTNNIGKTVTEHGIFWNIPYSFSGAAFLVSRKVNDLIGYFNEDYGLYGEEDADYCLRCHYAGIRKYSYDARNMLKHNGTDNSVYKDKNVDKAMAHNINVGYGKRTGIFALNIFLYKNKLRDLNILRKYKIKNISNHTIEIEENSEYTRFHDRLLECLKIYENHIDEASDEMLGVYKNILIRS